MLRADDALKYAAAILKSRSDWALDSIGGSMCDGDHDVETDALAGIVRDIRELAAQFGDPKRYADGRQIETARQHTPVHRHRIAGGFRVSITIKTVGGKELFVADTASDVREAVTAAVKARADLRGADLRGADLRGAYLRGAYLGGADLRGADLGGADLGGADLGGAYLRGAYLRGADVWDAYLGGADLRGADLGGADLRGATIPDLVKAQTNILPDEGDVIGWKKCRDGRIVKLRIPGDAKRSNATGRKCRAEYAEVLEITGPDGEACDVAYSSYDATFAYRPGERVTPTNGFSDDWWNECAAGLHFYITRLEAEAHL